MKTERAAQTYFYGPDTMSICKAESWDIQDFADLHKILKEEKPKRLIVITTDNGTYNQDLKLVKVFKEEVKALNIEVFIVNNAD